jgi:hypothetical protein
MPPGRRRPPRRPRRVPHLLPGTVNPSRLPPRLLPTVDCVARRVVLAPSLMMLFISPLINFGGARCSSTPASTAPSAAPRGFARVSAPPTGEGLVFFYLASILTRSRACRVLPPDEVTHLLPADTVSSPNSLQQF